MAISCQRSCSLVPTRGRPATHCGGGGTLNSVNHLVQPAMRLALSAMAAMASDSGTTSARSRMTVITTTASDRFPHSRAWIASITGQVGTTTIVAQITAGRNGSSIQNDATMRPPMKRTPSVIWARSRGCGFMRAPACSFRRQPGPRELEFCRPEVFDGEAANRAGGKYQRQFLPSPVADDRHLPDVRVAVHERDVAPVVALTPALEGFDDDEDAYLALPADAVARGRLQGGQLGLGQAAGDSGGQDAAAVAHDFCAHGSSVSSLWHITDVAVGSQ